MAKKEYEVVVTYMASMVVTVKAKSKDEAIALVEANDDNFDRNGWVQDLGDYSVEIL